MNTWFVRLPNAKDPAHTPPDIFLVTAENVEMAIAWLKRNHGVECKPQDLQNVVRTSRWTRRIY